MPDPAMQLAAKVASGGGAASTVASGVCNLIDLLTNWENLSRFEIAMDILSMALAAAAILAA